MFDQERENNARILTTRKLLSKCLKVLWCVIFPIVIGILEILDDFSDDDIKIKIKITKYAIGGFYLLCFMILNYITYDEDQPKDDRLTREVEKHEEKSKKSRIKIWIFFISGKILYYSEEDKYKIYEAIKPSLNADISLFVKTKDAKNLEIFVKNFKKLNSFMRENFFRDFFGISCEPRTGIEIFKEMITIDSSLKFDDNHFLYHFGLPFDPDVLSYISKRMNIEPNEKTRLDLSNHMYSLNERKISRRSELLNFVWERFDVKNYRDPIDEQYRELFNV